MKRHNKITSVILAAVLALACFAGCGKEPVETASSEQESGNAKAVGIVGEWKAAVDERENICHGVSFNDNGEYSRYITIDGVKTVLSNGKYKFTEGDEDSANGVANIFDNQYTDYLPQVSKRWYQGSYWITSVDSDLMAQEGIRADDIIVSEMLDEKGVEELKVGDIITYCVYEGDRFTGLTMTHTISETTVDENGKKICIMNYESPVHKHDSDLADADKILGKFICRMKPLVDPIDWNVGDCPFTISNEGAELTLRIYEETYVFERG